MNPSSEPGGGPHVEKASGGTLAERVGPVWSAARVIDALGLSDALALQAEVSAGRVLGLITSDGKFVAPVSQFYSNAGKVSVRPHLDVLFKALRGQAPWMVAQFLTAPGIEELDGQTVVEAALSDRPERIDEFALRLSREWSAGSSGATLAFARVMAGTATYDDLDKQTQADVRSMWEDHIAALRDSLNLSDDFAAEGRSWSEVDDDGSLVTRNQQDD